MNSWMDRLRGIVKPWTTGTEPMELRRAVLDDVESRVMTAGSGKRVFPYNRLEVRLLADTPERKEGLEAIVRDLWDRELRGDIADRLREAGSQVPAGLSVDIQVTDERTPEFGERYWHVAYTRAEGGASSAAGTPSPRPALVLTIVKGQAKQRVYSFETSDRITLGRLEEIEDEEGRIRRRNDVAFLEEGEENRTVSREQARIVWDAATGEYRLRAEPGASVTRILRDGRTIDVSAHDRRGVRLLAGDEIYLGKAQLKVGIRVGGDG